MIEILGNALFALIIILGLTYALTVDMMGHEVAKRQTLELLYVVLFLPPTFLVFYYFPGNHGLFALYVFSSSTIIIYLFIEFIFSEAQICCIAA